MLYGLLRTPSTATTTETGALPKDWLTTKLTCAVPGWLPALICETYMGTPESNTCTRPVLPTIDRSETWTVAASVSPGEGAEPGPNSPTLAITGGAGSI